MGGLLELTAFIGLTALLLVLFAAWLFVAVARTVFRMLGFIFGSDSHPHLTGVTCRCQRLRCGAFNPIEANYCRRCGSFLRRAALSRGRAAA